MTAITEEITASSTEQTALIEGAVNIMLSDEEIMVDGEAISENAEDAVYAANDIVYYEEGKDFKYGEGTEADAHSKEEADSHTVVHITKPGTYAVSGKISAGQIAVDLGEDAEEDPEAVVTLILNGVDITSTVAPAILAYNVYECGPMDEDTATK
ncbi:MAG: carbohydrate-binding domain-containing protein, partial [Lachnospiraceae bacterium]|nr:carbohydrate-binding domain-containing protein [Lachnospiraceae bacterium]